MGWPAALWASARRVSRIDRVLEVEDMRESPGVAVAQVVEREAEVVVAVHLGGVRLRGLLACKHEGPPRRRPLPSGGAAG